MATSKSVTTHWSPPPERRFTGEGVFHIWRWIILTVLKYLNAAAQQPTTANLNNNDGKSVS
jgi:hypothetical protein